MSLVNKVLVMGTNHHFTKGHLDQLHLQPTHVHPEPSMIRKLEYDDHDIWIVLKKDSQLTLPLRYVEKSSQ